MIIKFVQYKMSGGLVLNETLLDPSYIRQEAVELMLKLLVNTHLYKAPGR